MKDRFQIGELAKIFSISTDTLRHYDKIDLLKPDQDPYNKYRYYDINSMFKLSRILFLKNLEISLSDIERYMKRKNAEGLLNMLKRKDEDLEMRIQHLTNMKEKINAKLTLFEQSRNRLDEIYLTHHSPKQGIFLDTKKLKDASEAVALFKNSQNYLKISSWLVEGQVYTSLSKDDMTAGIFNQFRYFVEIKQANITADIPLITLPANEYACMTVIGPYTDLPKHYGRLVEWIYANHYRIIGDSIENNIVDSDYSDSDNEFITELQIPVKRQ